MSDDSTSSTNENQPVEQRKCIRDILLDKETRKLLIQKLKDSGHMEKDVVPDRPCTGKNPASQMDNGMWPAIPVQFPFASFPPSPY